MKLGGDREEALRIRMLKLQRLYHLCAMFLVVVCVVCLCPLPGFAYVGPGAGLSVIGTIVALIVAIILAIVGFIWYPIKRILAKWKDKPKSAE